MRTIGIIGATVVCLVIGLAQNGDASDQERARLYDRIHQLESENGRLALEVNKLREQVRNLQKRAEKQRRRNYGYSGGGYGIPYPYGTASPMSGAARQMREAEQMKRSWENLTR